MRTTLAVAVVALLIVGGATAFVTGFSGGNRAPDTGPTGQSTATPGVSGGGGASTATASDDADAAGTTPAPRPFGFVVKRIRECGRTCRDVTVTLSNQQNETARDVSVRTRIYAGEDASGDPIWTGKRDVGRLGPGESTTTTERVKLSFSEALAVKSADGKITVRTTVRSEDHTMTFTRHRDVDG